ncbi:MAG TPA: hypothetical protein VG756_03470 [Pseudonocardiaceae bacterium]|nr:hypothetical protein [Pseudonocardiaceae bacterium]
MTDPGHAAPRLSIAARWRTARTRRGGPVPETADDCSGLDEGLTLLWRLAGQLAR